MNLLDTQITIWKFYKIFHLCWFISICSYEQFFLFVKGITAQYGHSFGEVLSLYFASFEAVWVAALLEKPQDYDINVGEDAVWQSISISHHQTHWTFRTLACVERQPVIRLLRQPGEVHKFRRANKATPEDLSSTTVWNTEVHQIQTTKRSAICNPEVFKYVVLSTLHLQLMTWVNIMLHNIFFFLCYKKSYSEITLESFFWIVTMVVDTVKVDACMYFHKMFFCNLHL